MRRRTDSAKSLPQTATASAGGNSMHGDYEVEDDKLLVAQLGSTAIGCDQALSAQDTWLASLLGARPSIALSGDTLTLTTSTVTLTFLDRRGADPDRPLVGVTWTIDSYITGDAVSAYVGAVVPTVRFEADGSVQVDSGCNTARGTYRADGDRITLSRSAQCRLQSARPQVVKEGEGGVVRGRTGM